MKPFKLPPEIEALSGDQRQQLDSWLDDVDQEYLDVMQRLEHDFGIRITRGKLIRYNQKRGLAQELSDQSEVALEVPDLLDLFNGRPVKFSEAGLILIQKRAFELAAEPKTSATRLNSLLRVLSYQKQAELKERRVKATEMTAEARLLTAEAAMIRAAAATDLKRQKNAPAPEDPAEVVMQRCKNGAFELVSPAPADNLEFNLKYRSGGGRAPSPVPASAHARHSELSHPAEPTPGAIGLFQSSEAANPAALPAACPESTFSLAAA